MIKISIDEAAYSDVSKGLVRAVLKSLIRQYADNGILSLHKELSEKDIDIIFSTAFDILVQFEDFRGHVDGNIAHPVVVGFMSIPVTNMEKPDDWEEILISRRRSDLHGGVNAKMIRSVFKELRADSG